MSSKKNIDIKKTKKLILDHRLFLGVLILFVSFSSYSLFSLFNSTGDYIKNMYVSVVEVDEWGGDTAKNVENLLEKNRNVELVEIFSDMDSEHVNAEAIGSLYGAGIVDGYSDKTFKPDDLINRAELLVILTTALDVDFSEGVLENCFSDVHDEWFSVFVCYAKDRDWINGYIDGSYRPSRGVSKAEALKIAFGAFDYEVCDSVIEESYEDVVTDSWYAPYACSAKRDGIVASAGLFKANHQMTRAEFSQIIYNIMVNQELI